LTGDEYLLELLRKYAVYTGAGSSCFIEKQSLSPIIQQWAGQYLLDFDFSGSTAKGTGVKGSNDVDLFISLDPQTSFTLKEIYDSLHKMLSEKGFSPRRRNVSIGITHNNLSVDLTPGRKLAGNTTDHSIFRNKAQMWTKTNVSQHINVVKQSGRIDEIRLVKIWRNLNRLEFPSFYLELTVIDALYNKNNNQPAANFLTILDYLKDYFAGSRVVDPANCENIVSDDLTSAEKETVARAAALSRSKNYWGEIIW
jgi:predicted nucleotidyltransferase